jgi:hypothetical protein
MSLHRFPRKLWRRLGAAIGLALALAVGPSAPAHAAETSNIGPALYDTVQAYSAFGAHRVGTPVDAATLAWFAAELRRRGGRVERLPFRFDRFDATTQVTIDGERVASLPLFYQGQGEVIDEQPYTVSIPVLDNDRATPVLIDTIASARAAGARSVVIATQGPLGELQTPNRVPTLAEGPPVVLIAGRHGDALRAGAVRVQFSGRIVPGESANVVAAFGAESNTPIVINTPLTGWFNAAAERGTGIAIAIALAERIAPRHPVLVIGSPGHELLPHIGLTAYLQQLSIRPALVVHLGANVALGRRDENGRWRLIETRAVGARMAAAAYARVLPALEPLAVKPYFNPPRWLGEGALWAEKIDAPMLSFVGIGPQFHSPADLPENTTSPALMGQVFEAIAAAVEAWLDSAKP